MHTIELVWGNRSLNLNSSPFGCKAVSVSLLEPIATMTSPESGKSALVNLKPTDRVITITLSVSGTTGAIVANALTSLKLLVDGENQIAARDGENPVCLKLDRDGGNGNMLHRVRYGNVMDGAAHWSVAATNNTPKYAIDVTLRLICDEAGQAETTVSLKNMLLNGDFTISSGGLGTSWTETGTPTTTLSTTNWLINGQSQKVVADAAGEGIHSEDIAGATSAVAYAWVYVTSGSAVVAIRDTAGPTDLDNATIDATDSGGVSDMSAIDEDGKTWYRVPLSWSGSSSTIDLQIRAYASGAATFYVDGCYLRTGTTTVPDAWSSYWDIDNRNDRTTTNPEYVNYIDYWGVPGDSPAYLQLSTDAPGYTSSNPLIHYWSQMVDGEFTVANARHWAESDMGSYAVVTAGTGAWTDGTGTTDNHYKRFTEGATNNGGYVEFGSGFFALSSTTVNAFWSIPRRVLVLCRSNTTNVTITGSVVQGTGGTRTTVESNDATSVTAANDWEWIDLGAVNRVGALPDGEANVVTSLMPRIDITGLANTNTFDIDAVLFLPARDNGLLIFQTTVDGNQISGYTIRGDNESITALGNAADIADVLEVGIGGCWTVQPGHRTTRVIWAFSDNANTTTITGDMGVTSTITPRARLLLGEQQYL